MYIYLRACVCVCMCVCVCVCVCECFVKEINLDQLPTQMKYTCRMA